MARKSWESDVDELVRSLGFFLRRVRATGAGSELSLSELAALGRLERGGPATVAELARGEGVKPQSMGATIAALEDRRLVERKAHPTDGRQVNILLTPRGLAMRESVKVAKRTWLAQALAQLSKQEQETLFAAGGLLRRLAERDPQ